MSVRNDLEVNFIFFYCALYEDPGECVFTGIKELFLKLGELFLTYGSVPAIVVFLPRMTQ